MADGSTHQPTMRQRRGKGTRWRNLTPERRAEIEAAMKLGVKRRSLNSRIDWIAERAAAISDEQAARLRSLLPDPGPDDAEAAS